MSPSHSPNREPPRMPWTSASMLAVVLRALPAGRGGQRQADGSREGQGDARRVTSLVVQGEAAYDRADRNPEEDRRPEIDQALERARQHREIRNMHGTVAGRIDDHRERPRDRAHAGAEVDAVGSEAEDRACLRGGIADERLTWT